jgi:hypothetical protein
MKSDLFRDPHTLNGRFEERMAIPSGFGVVKRITFTIIFGMYDDTFSLPGEWVYLDLDFSIRVNTNIKYLAVLSKPGVSPPTVITNPNWSYCIDYSDWVLVSIIHLCRAPN